MTADLRPTYAIRLREAGNEVIELSGVTPNPRLDKVFECVNLVREHWVNLILAVGGDKTV